MTALAQLLANRLTLEATHPAECELDHCGTGNSASPRFPMVDGHRELYFDHLGYAAHLVVLSCMDCGTELVRYSRMRRLVKPKSRLSWRHDDQYRGSW